MPAGTRKSSPGSQVHSPRGGGGGGGGGPKIYPFFVFSNIDLNTIYIFSLDFPFKSKSQVFSLFIPLLRTTATH